MSQQLVNQAECRRHLQVGNVSDGEDDDIGIARGDEDYRYGGGCVNKCKEI